MVLPARTPGNGSPARSVSRRQSDGTTLSLYRGRKRLALLRDLALGEWSTRELADQLGVMPSEVATFAALYADEISEIRISLAGELAIETAGLWISKKVNRVAEYQSDVEEIESDIVIVKGMYGPGSREHINLLRTKAILMRTVADEYAPVRGGKDTGEDKNVIRYVLEDPDAEAMT